MKNIVNSLQNMRLMAKSILLFVLGGLGAFAFAPYYYIPLLWIGLLLLMRFLILATSKKQIFLLAFSYGAGLGAVSLSWICHALTVDGGAFAFLIPISLVGLGFFMGIFYAIPACVSFFFKTPVSRWLAFASSFVFFEWVRSWLLTGFPWNLLGNIWTGFLPFLQTASFVGVYGLSLITILLFTSLALLPVKRYFISTIVLFCLLSMAGGLQLYDANKETVWGIKLRLVQPNIPQSLKWDPVKAQDNYSTLLRLSRENNDDITHVIWPESALPFYPDIDQVETVRLMSAVRQGGTLMTGGLRVVNLQKRQLANSLFVFDDRANMLAYYDKSHLVPFGEYMPLRDLLKIDKIVPIPSDCVRGDGVKTLYVPKAPLVAPLVCYEVIFPGHVVDKKRRPEWILNITNDAWYGLTAGPYQHLSIAQMRAVEEGLPLVRATNNGVSAVINPYGEIIASLGLGEPGVVDSFLPRAQKRTVYAEHGNKVPLLFVLGVFLLALIKARKKK